MVQERRRPAVPAVLSLAMLAVVAVLLRDDTRRSDERAAPLDAAAPRTAQHSADPASERADARDAQPTALAPPPVAAPADAAPAWPAGFETMSVSGRVLDPSGAPVAGAEVLLLPDGRSQRGLGVRIAPEEGDLLVDLQPGDLERTLTDDTGRFELVGAWRPRAGGSPTEHHFAFPVALVRAAGFALHGFECAGFAGGSHDLGDLRLATPAGSIRARLVDARDGPVAGGRAGLSHDPPGRTRPEGLPPVPAPHFRTVSDELGSWVADHLWPGDYELRFVAEGYEPLRVEVPLASGEQRDLGTLMLRRGAHVAGTVRDLDGRPVAGARVTVADASFGRGMPDAAEGDAAWLLAVFPFQIREGVRTDAEGRYRVDGLLRQEAPYRVIAVADGHEVDWVGDVGPDSEGVDLALPREAQVHVEAYDRHSGDVVDEFELLAFRDINRWAPLTHPAMRHFSRLPVSEDVVHNAGPFGTRLLVRAAGSTWALRDVVGLAPGEALTVRVPLEPAHVLRVRCVDDRGEPVEGATLRLTAPPGWGTGFRSELDEPLASPRTDAEGLALIEGLPAEEWVVSAQAEGHEPPAPHTFTMPLADLQVDLVLPRKASLRGRVLTAGGTPAVAERVVWQTGARRFRTFLSDVDGRFEIDHPGSGGTLVVPRAAPLEVALQSGDRREVEVLQGAPFVIEGRVLRGGAPAAGVHVQLWGPESLASLAQREDAESDQDGSFRFVCDYAGPYGVHAFADGLGESVSVQAEPGGHAFVELRFGGASLGGVLESSEEGLDPSRLRVTLSRGGTVLGRTQPDAEGRFRFSGLAPGSYELGTHGGGSVAESWGPYELASDEALDTVELTPSAGARLFGHALHADGTPFAGHVHLRSADGVRYELAWLRLGDGYFEFRGLAPGTWRLDLAKQHTRVLGRGPDGVGEPGAELPFFGGTTVSLAPGEVRALDVIATGAGTAR